MLAALGPELLGRVLSSLPAYDLHTARLASRIFDEASRAHTDRASTLWLKLVEFADLPRPDWARFPRLRRLVLHGFCGDRFPEELRDWFPPQATDAAAAALAGLEEVDAGDLCLEAPLWGALLQQSPAVRRVVLPMRAYDGWKRLALFATVASLAPRLEALCAEWFGFDPRSAALISCRRCASCG